jgi:hypothetical protein
MASRVVFDEDVNSAFAKPPLRSTDQKLVERGIAHTTLNARLMLMLLCACLIGGAFYFLISAIPEEPRLGGDIPRAGEKIPTNRSI